MSRGGGAATFNNCDLNSVKLQWLTEPAGMVVKAHSLCSVFT